jgi:uncharacterized membrane protein AbrB (regulator of aidB expression)
LVRRIRLPRSGHGQATLERGVMALAIGIAGGLAALFIGTPLPWLLGSMVSVGFVAMFTRTRPDVPRNMRTWFVPVIGVAIGAAFTPEILREAGRWWPSLVALCVFIPSAISFFIL